MRNRLGIVFSENRNGNANFEFNFKAQPVSLILQHRIYGS